MQNCFQNMNCFCSTKLISVLIHLKHWYYDFACLELPTIFICSSLLPLFCPAPFNQMPPQVLDIPNHVASQANQIYYQVVYRSSYLMFQARYPSKSKAFKSHFSFKFRQLGLHQLYFQCKVCWTLYKMVGVPSFSEPYLRM